MYKKCSCCNGKGVVFIRYPAGKEGFNSCPECLGKGYKDCL